MNLFCVNFSLRSFFLQYTHTRVCACLYGTPYFLANFGYVFFLSLKRNKYKFVRGTQKFPNINHINAQNQYRFRLLCEWFVPQPVFLSFAFRSALPILFRLFSMVSESLFFIGIYIFVSPGLLFSWLMQMRLCIRFGEVCALFSSFCASRIFFHVAVLYNIRKILACELCFEFEFAQETKHRECIGLFVFAPNIHKYRCVVAFVIQFFCSTWPFCILHRSLRWAFAQRRRRVVIIGVFLRN